MLISALLMAATPVTAQPVQPEPVICKVIKSHPLKSRRITACGTDAQWQEYRAHVQQAERNVIHRSQAYSGVGSGY
jgi:hypothetical protein